MNHGKYQPTEDINWPLRWSISIAKSDKTIVNALHVVVQLNVSNTKLYV